MWESSERSDRSRLGDRCSPAAGATCGSPAASKRRCRTGARPHPGRGCDDLPRRGPPRTSLLMSSGARVGVAAATSPIPSPRPPTSRRTSEKRDQKQRRFPRVGLARPRPTRCSQAPLRPFPVRTSPKFLPVGGVVWSLHPVNPPHLVPLVELCRDAVDNRRCGLSKPAR